MTHRRLRVLVSAYACNPYQGSEPGVGWGFVKALSQLHDLCVIVEEEKCKDDILRYLAEHEGELPGAQFFFIRKRRNRLLRKLWPPSYYWFYRRWQLDALALARELHSERSFDLAHHLTMVGFREPGYLWRLGVPFVWGPTGGLGHVPWRFLPRLGWKSALYYTAYNLFNFWHERTLSRVRIAARKADGSLIAATGPDARDMKRLWGAESTYIAEVGVDPMREPALVRRGPAEPLKIVWSGLHIPRKALDLGLEALARLPQDAPWELHVLGRGPLSNRWIELAKDLGIGDRCRFHGWLARSEALKISGGAHVSLITSLRDLTSTVTVESLAHGQPVVCLDHCGFSSAISDDCGIKVPVTSPTEVVAGLAAALERLFDEDLRLRLAQGAIARAATFDWRAKAQAMDAIYRRAVA